MFWGLVLEAGKRYAQTVDKPFHVSMASLDVPKSENELVSVNVNFQNADFILCNLQKHKVFQTPLDLNFMAGDRIAFYTIGKGRVHLTGYLIDDEMGIEPEEESEDEQVANEVSKQKTPIQVNKQEKRKSAGQTPGKPVAKKSKLESDEEDVNEEGGDSDTEDSDADVEMGSVEELEIEEEDEDEEGDDDDDFDDEEDDDESDEGEDMTPQKLQPQGKKEKQQSAQKLQKQQQQNNQATTPNEIKKKKEKTPGGATPGAQANGTPEMQSGKKNKKKGGETPGEVKGSQTPKPAPGGSPGQTPQKKVLEGGVAVEELVIGSGQVAKPGRMVSVYYTGRLKQNNKKFDETLQGPGFKFRLGKGEVIKGWDIGLTGMKVGGKRKITIPSHLGYGQKGSPPVVPPNSVLVFDVELRNVF